MERRARISATKSGGLETRLHNWITTTRRPSRGSRLIPIDSNRDGCRRYALICLLVCGALLAGVSDTRGTLAASGQAPIEVLRVPELEAGFHLLYQLKPAEAHVQFEAWEQSHPEDPLGSASEAAAYLFEECYRQGVLTSAFFLDDKRFLGKIPLKPDPELRAAFFVADKQAQELAQMRLGTDPDDPNALFAMTLSVGMQADYASLIDKRQVDSLKMIKDADRYAKKLLAIAPDADDAYLTWARPITLSDACRESKSSSLASRESTATRKLASSSSRSPPITATTCGRLRRFCWRWRPCARKSRNWRACSSANSSRNSPRIPLLPRSCPNSVPLPLRDHPLRAIALSLFLYSYVLARSHRLVTGITSGNTTAVINNIILIRGEQIQ